MTDKTNPSTDPAREAGNDASRAAERLAKDARSTAEDLGEKARGEAWSQAERARSGVASEVGGIADALRKAAREMRSGSPQERTFGQIAEGLADASDNLANRDVGQLAEDVSRFARGNPIAFLGGAALAGFAVTRFARASSSPPDAGYAGHDRSRSPSEDRGGSLDRSARTDRSSDPGADRPDRDLIPGPVTSPVNTASGTATPATATATATGTPSPTVIRPRRET